MPRHVRLLIVILLCALAAPRFAAGPPVGQIAPTFRLQDQDGHWRSPADYHGNWLVLRFYPKDFTPGCTIGMCTFRDDIVKLRKAGADVVGVGLDNVQSHADFAAKYHVPFPLLSDASHTAATVYGVLTSTKGQHYATRTTFLIHLQGRFTKVYVDVDPQKNSAQVMHDLAALKAAS